MDRKEIEQKCEQFLQSLGVPGFIVFGWQEADKKFSVVSSAHHMPTNAAIKAITWALHDFVNKAL